MNNIIQPLKIYTSAEYKVSARDSYTHYRQVIPLWVDSTHLLPFVLKWYVSDDATTIYKLTSILIYDRSGNYIDITSNITLTHINNLNDSTDTYGMAVYKGGSTISALKQGIYYIYFKNENNDEFWSEDFNVGFPEKTVKIEFSNSISINKLFFSSDFYYSMTFATVTYDTGEYADFKKEFLDEYNHPIQSLIVSDKIWGIDILVDYTCYDSLKMLESMDTVLITNEYGIQSDVKIISVKGDPFGRSNYIFVTLKYRNSTQWISNIDTKTTQVVGTQEGKDVVEETGHHKVGGHYITIGGKKIKT